MIKAVKLGKEIQIGTGNKVGVLANVSKLLTEKGINIEGVAGHVVNNEAKLMVITDDALRTMDALNKAGYKEVKENQVVIVELENKPGALKTVTSILAAAKIDIKQVYGTACIAGCPAQLVLSTSDNDKALVELKK
ncbi:MAG: hypothetical protein ABSE81_02820 [Candidatus Omnitrophota bacterium]|jgi:hypothetical protein